MLASQSFVRVKSARFRKSPVPRSESQDLGDDPGVPRKVSDLKDRETIMHQLTQESIRRRRETLAARRPPSQNRNKSPARSRISSPTRSTRPDRPDRSKCQSAYTTKRPKSPLKKSRPQTAPNDFCRLERINSTLDLNELDYINVPDSGTDSDGERFIFGRDKAQMQAARRGIFEYLMACIAPRHHLCAVKEINQKFQRVMKGSEIECQSTLASANIHPERLGMRNSKFGFNKPPSSLRGYSAAEGNLSGSTRNSYEFSSKSLATPTKQSSGSVAQGSANHSEEDSSDDYLCYIAPSNVVVDRRPSIGVALEPSKTGISARRLSSARRRSLMPESHGQNELGVFDVMDTLAESAREGAENALITPEIVETNEQSSVVRPMTKPIRRMHTKKWDQKTERKTLAKQEILLIKSLMEVENELSDTLPEPGYRFTEDGRLISNIAVITHNDEKEDENPYEESRCGVTFSSDRLFAESEPGDNEPSIAIEDTDGYVNPLLGGRVQRSLPGSFYVRRMTVLKNRKSSFMTPNEAADNFLSKIGHQISASSAVLTEVTHEEERSLSRSKNLLVSPTTQSRKVILAKKILRPQKSHAGLQSLSESRRTANHESLNSVTLKENGSLSTSYSDIRGNLMVPGQGRPQSTRTRE